MGPVVHEVIGPDMVGPLGADDGPWVIAGKPPGSHITDLLKPWQPIRARRIGGRANS